MNVFGVIGWKNSGKTGLVERLVYELNRRGFSVSTLKHAHHSFDVDRPGKDSYRHRVAGASQVMVSSEERSALISEFRGSSAPSLSTLLTKLEPVDIVLVEGWKCDSYPKIETWRSVNDYAVLAETDPTILAVASDLHLELNCPNLDLNDTNSITDFILKNLEVLK